MLQSRAKDERSTSKHKEKVVKPLYTTIPLPDGKREEIPLNIIIEEICAFWKSRIETHQRGVLCFCAWTNGPECNINIVLDLSARVLCAHSIDSRQSEMLIKGDKPRIALFLPKLFAVFSESSKEFDFTLKLFKTHGGFTEGYEKQDDAISAIAASKYPRAIGKFCPEDLDEIQPCLRCTKKVPLKSDCTHLVFRKKIPSGLPLSVEERYFAACASKTDARLSGYVWAWNAGCWKTVMPSCYGKWVILDFKVGDFVTSVLTC